MWTSARSRNEPFRETRGDGLTVRFRFSEPFGVIQRGWRTTIGYGAIVYRVRAWKPDGSGPLEINRAAGADPDGILDIGESGRGRDRLEAFARSALGEKLVSHRAGIEYSAEWGYDFASAFPHAHLRVDVLQVSCKELAEAIELFLLEQYRWRYKDRPPLNSSAGKYRKVKKWLEDKNRDPRNAAGWIDLDGLVDDLLAVPAQGSDT